MKMKDSAANTVRPDLRDLLAAERTFLAWIRTGLALMGFGFVVARFGLFLQQLQAVQHSSRSAPYGQSLWFGTALIAVGVIVFLLSALHHVRLVRELERGAPPPSRPSAQAVGIALFLAAVGLAMAIYLVFVHGSEKLHGPSELESSMVHQTANKGITRHASAYSVDQTVERLREVLANKGVTLFALIDHSGEAEKAGLKMPPTKLLIFGNPKAGTPVMLASPSSAIDLPLKILIAEDTEGKVWLSYNTPEYLKTRHGLPDDVVRNLAVIETLASLALQ